MKISLLIAFLIVFAGGMIGWHDQRALVRLRKEYQVLVLEAERVGLAVGNLDEGAAGAPRLSKRERERREEEVRAFALELIAFAKHMEELEEKGDGAGEKEVQRQAIEMMGRLLELDPKELKLLVAEIRSTDDLSDEMRQSMVGFALMMLAEQHPESALTLFTESADLLDEGGQERWMVSSALTKWASKDPLAALDWIRQNSEKHPELVSEDAKRAVVAGATATDPALAFRLLQEFEIKNESGAFMSMVQQVGSPEQRSALLVAAREADLESESSRWLMHAMSGPLAEGGFEEAVGWMSEVEMSPEEKQDLAMGLDYHQTAEETGRWMEWMESLEEAPEGAIKSLMSQWTNRDYRAAGEWLVNTKTGEFRDQAVVTYAGTVAPYDPEIAAQWAGEISEESIRMPLIEQIHFHWVKSDPEAAAVFAAEQGLEE